MYDSDKGETSLQATVWYCRLPAEHLIFARAAECLRCPWCREELVLCVREVSKSQPLENPGCTTLTRPYLESVDQAGGATPESLILMPPHCLFHSLSLGWNVPSSISAAVRGRQSFTPAKIIISTWLKCLKYSWRSSRNCADAGFGSAKCSEA